MRARIGERRLHARDHVEQDRADALLSFADVDARRRDPFAEEAFLRALERIVIGSSIADRATARHAVVLFVEEAFLVLFYVAWAFVRRAERRTDHHARGSCREIERDVTRMTDTTVRPNVLAERARFTRADE